MNNSSLPQQTYPFSGQDVITTSTQPTHQFMPLLYDLDPFSSFWSLLQKEKKKSLSVCSILINVSPVGHFMEFRMLAISLTWLFPLVNYNLTLSPGVLFLAKVFCSSHLISSLVKDNHFSPLLGHVKSLLNNLRTISFIHH